MEENKSELRKAIEYFKSNKGETVSKETGEIIFSEEKEIIEGLIRYISRR